MVQAVEHPILKKKKNHVCLRVLVVRLFDEFLVHSRTVARISITNIYCMSTRCHHNSKALHPSFTLNPYFNLIR
jgi:hypothetical protein